MGCNQSKPAANVDGTDPRSAPQSAHTNKNGKADVERPTNALNQVAATMDKVQIFHKSTYQRAGEDIKEGAVRLRNVFAAPIQMLGDFVAPIHAKTDADKDFIEKALLQMFIFESLEKAEMNTLINAFERSPASDRDIVIKQGDLGDFFYVIKTGKIRYEVDGMTVGQGAPGAHFGDLALLYNCPRAATCIAEGDTELWRVDQTTFRKIIATHTIKEDNAVKEALKDISFLKDLDAAYLSRITDALVEEKLKKGTVIFEKGSIGDKFYIVQEGQCSITNIGMGGSRYVDQVVKKGDYFGERALITGETRAAKVTAKTNVTLLVMTRDKFLKILGPLENIMDDAQIKTYLMGVPFIAKAKKPLRKIEIEELANMMEVVTFRKDATIALEGDVAHQALYIIANGKVSSRDRNNEIRMLLKGDYFGEETMKPDYHKLQQATVVALEDTRCKVLKMSHLQSMFQHSISAIWGHEWKDYDKKLFDHLGLSRLKKHRILGAGTFGKVWLVEDKERPGVAYALKIQNKRTILSYRQEEGVNREKSVMSTIDNPFVISLVNAFQDDFNLYMVLKLYQGGELFSLIHHEKGDGMPEEKAKFYAAGILEGLSYMHKRKILYRDLKPENVLIDSDGYTVIVDLGFAKVVADKTYTLCGTPLYLAPEVILQRGHNRAADIWSFGVLTFELILGYTPFYSRDIDQVTLFKKICRGQYKLPDKGMSAWGKDLVIAILKPRQSERLGMLALGDDEIRNHEWFMGSVDWEAVRKHEMVAPWIPKVKNPLDSSNFDDWGHLEAEDKNKPKELPLSAKEEAPFKADWPYIK